MATVSVERGLKILEAAVRQPVEAGLDRTFGGKLILRAHGLSLFGHQVDAANDLEAALAIDPRFEHMKPREIEDAVQRFTELSHEQRAEAHSSAFIAEHAQKPLDLTCSFPVEGLAPPGSFLLCGVTFTPADQVEIPDLALGPFTNARIDCVASAACHGTNGQAMMRRARHDVEHALSVLRASLRQDVYEPQLRLRLGMSHWFNGGGGGWQHNVDLINLGLNDQLIESVLTMPIAALRASGGAKAEQCARCALGWYERAQTETDPSLAISLLCFALEAILGDPSERLKAESLALRRAVLAHVRTGSFADPTRTQRLYEETRSNTVHGEAPLEAQDREVHAFSADVRAAINEFLDYAAQHDLKKRSEVRRQLEQEPSLIDIRNHLQSG